MQPKIEVLSDPVQPRIRVPGLGEEGYRDGLSIIIQRQSDRSYGVHDGSVMDDEDWDVECVCSKEEIGVGRRAEIEDVNLVQLEKLGRWNIPEWISDDKE